MRTKMLTQPAKLKSKFLYFKEKEEDKNGETAFNTV